MLIQSELRLTPKIQNPNKVLKEMMADAISGRQEEKVGREKI